MATLNPEPNAAKPALAGIFHCGGLDFTRLRLRRAQPEDLEIVNALVGRAIQSWDLPDRIKRISLPIYLYRTGDLEFMHVIVAEDPDGKIVGVAAWEPAAAKDAPRGRSALLLHGIYVDPDLHRCGIGSRLLDAAVQVAASDNYDGLVVKAQSDAVAFFEALGLERLAEENPHRNYPYRFWYPTRPL